MWKRWYDRWTAPRFQAANDDEDFVLVTWDSCRYDAYAQARTPVLDEFGDARRAWAQATYTLPAHLAMYFGFLPHAMTPEPLYNRFYQQLWRICHRHLLTKPLVTFPLGTQNIVSGFRQRGYFTLGVAAMDWFRDADALRQGFERFHVTGSCAARQNAIVEREVERRARRRPLFALVNYGETHSPFTHSGMSMPPASGDHFAHRRLIHQRTAPHSAAKFDTVNFARQVACAEFLDSQMAGLIELFRRRGRPTTLVVCSDHGECFGEDGLYGHGFYHEKVMEVFLLIFRLNAPPHAVPADLVEWSAANHAA